MLSPKKEMLNKKTDVNSILLRKTFKFWIF